MEQDTVFGQERLTPPDRDLARHYLAEADAIVDRRERVVDRRAAAWLTIVNALILAGYFSIASVSLRQQVPSVDIQTLLVPLLVWSQISTGISQRGDRGPRNRRARWLVWSGGAVVLVATMVVFVLSIVDRSMPIGWMLLVSAVILLTFGGYGVVRLIAASRGPRPLPPVRAPLTPGARWGTVIIGVLLGAACAVGAVSDDILRGFLLLLLLLAMIVVFGISSSGIGLPFVGASWRWPHLVALAASIGLLLVLRLTSGTGVEVAPLIFLLGGLGIVALFVVVSGIRGRDLDA